MAQAWLFALSGARVGTFTTIEQQYEAACSSECGVPYKGADGEWRNGGVGMHDCCRIELMSQPVVAVDEVRLWGVALSSDSFVHVGNSVRRLGACWPCEAGCEVPPIEVDYTWGVRPDALTLAAAGELACEMVGALVPGRECGLPSGAVQVVRQGVTVTRPDLSTILDAGLTGMPLTDTFIRAHNPNRLSNRSRVVAIDGARIAT
jgi:hypothetical protein